jgi:hypothetical protein
MKTIKEYKLDFYGVTHNQMFRGVGTTFTDFDQVVTGIGKTEKQAFEDALDQVAQVGFDPSTIGKPEDLSETRIKDLESVESDPATGQVNPELNIRVSIYLR